MGFWEIPPNSTIATLFGNLEPFVRIGTAASVLVGILFWGVLTYNVTGFLRKLLEEFLPESIKNVKFCTFKWLVVFQWGIVVYVLVVGFSVWFIWYNFGLNLSLEVTVVILGVLFAIAGIVGWYIKEKVLYSNNKPLYQPGQVYRFFSMTYGGGEIMEPLKFVHLQGVQSYWKSRKFQIPRRIPLVVLKGVVVQPLNYKELDGKEWTFPYNLTPDKNPEEFGLRKRDMIIEVSNGRAKDKQV